MKYLQELLSLSASLNILYAEDDVELRQTTASLLRDLNFHVEEADHGKVALEKFMRDPSFYDIIITDLNMPYMGGMELIQEIQAIHSDQAIIVVSAHNETEFFLESIRKNILGYILKPIDFEQLIFTLYKAASHVHVRKENEAFKTHLEEMVETKTALLKQSHEEIHTFLTIDKTTQLPNATMLITYIDTLTCDNVMTTLLFSIDDLNTLYQNYGASISDEILAKVGTFLQYNIPKEAKLYKYNSDEFVIIMDAAWVDPLFLVTQIQAFFKETPVHEFNHAPIYVTLSCGIATTHQSSLLLPFARTALEEAHTRGLPNQCHVYDAVAHTSDTETLKTLWVQKFRQALEENRVIPVFHPVVDNQTKEIVVYECLARIEEEGYMVTPAYFLEAARRSGLMCNLTRSMIHQCFKIFSQKEISFSINITKEDLLNPSFCEFIQHKHEQFGIEPHRVILEILEDIILKDDNSSSLETLQTLKNLGYKIALDDFGSDRSNFNRFEYFQVDILKIDGQFIKNINTAPYNQNIVESIVLMAHKLNIKVVAEFVSTQDEWETLKALHVDYSQGYLFSKPLNIIPWC